MDFQYRESNFDYQGSVALERLNWSFFNPRLGLNWKINPNFSAYYSIARTGREPTRNDLFGGNDDLLSDDQGNALLFIQEAEYVTDQELGIRLNYIDLEIQLNAFFMDFDNEIVLNGQFGPNGLVLTNKVEQSLRSGLELSARWRLKNWNFTHHFSYNYSQIKEQEESFTPILTPPIIIFQELSYQWKKWRPSLSLRYQDAAFIDFANSTKLDAYILLNGGVEYTSKNWSFGLLVYNIGNQFYYNNGYVDFDGQAKYFLQAPTNFQFKIDYTW